MKRFDNHPSWIRYRDLLAQDFGIEFPTEPQEHHRQIRGHLVRYDEWLPAGAPVGVLILVHGGGGHGRILAPCALPAIACGWRVLAPDLPGYGLTTPASDFDGDYAEWPAVVAEIADQVEAGPVVLMGLSLGGMTAVSAAQMSARVRGLIVTTLLDISDSATFVQVARWPWLGRLSLAAMRTVPALFDRLIMPLGLATPLRLMSRNSALQRYFKRDRLLGGRWVRAKFFRTLHQHRLAHHRLDCPILLAHPGADDWTPVSMSMPPYEKIEGAKSFQLLSNGSHLPAESPAYVELGQAIQAFLGSVSRNPAPN
ncbi:MAG: alpha/beta hydrolase [Phenylobacterium sp.]|nr:alpha/beta hydrolase [Phenylobacterium sp.]